jgi:hypothetical protein
MQKVAHRVTGRQFAQTQFAISEYRNAIGKAQIGDLLAGLNGNFLRRQ